MTGSARYLSILAIVGFTALVFSAYPALAATAPTLGTAQSYGVLGHTTVTNTGPTVVNGDLGVSPDTAVTGFPPGIVTGTIHTADAAALQAQNDVTTAYNNLAGQTCDFGPFGPTDLAGQTLVPGVYCFSSSAANTGVLTLDAGGNNNAVWIFKMGSTLVTGPGSSVIVINGGQDCNVFWQVGSSATLDTTTNFVGNILALTSISLTTGATVSGRALARNGAVTTDTNVITPSMCRLTPTSAPTLGKGFSPFTTNMGGVSTLTITLTGSNTATLSGPLIDILPTGVTIANTPNASTTCDGTVSATAGGPNVTLSAGSIIPGACIVKVDVTAPLGGSYLNTLSANALQTDQGNNTFPAIATLIVTYQPLANISGMKFNDSNKNGINDGEQGLAGWTITLSGPVSATTTTDSSGKYKFTGLLPGTYTVSETQRGGWTQTAPKPVPPGTHTIVLKGSDVTGKDFGNFKKAPQLPPSPVPELSTLFLISTGIVGLLLMWRKKKD